uniref:Nonstructural protein 1 n=1 Tax=Porcine parvovirus 7 TaxID=1820046 RepID=A0A5B9RAP7_9VIRU|nr:nonstructural protein 1 [Porcine parvovirus 7]
MEHPGSRRERKLERWRWIGNTVVQETTPLESVALTPEQLEVAKAHTNMQQWQGMVMMLSNGEGRPRTQLDIRAIAFLLSELKTAKDWCFVAETNTDGILHYHCMVKTSQRSDALRDSVQRKWEQCKLAAMEDIEEPDPQIEVLKSQKAHRPACLLEYMMKGPLCFCAYSDTTMTLGASIFLYNQGQRFAEKEKQKQKRKQILGPEVLQGAHSLTRDLLGVIYTYNCQSAEDIFRNAPDLVVAHLHKPGFQQIVKNCLGFVDATKDNWSMQDNARRTPPDPTAIHTCLAHQGLDIDNFDATVYAWITKKSDKRNTIVLWGPSNTGKTAFIRGLRQVVNCGECVNGQIFCFEGLCGKAIGIWEEPLISPECAEKAKQIFEGADTQVPAKYKKPQDLPRTPIIMTTNHAPWRFCTSEEGALRNRMFIFIWDKDCTDGVFVRRSSGSCCQCRGCQGCGGGEVPAQQRGAGQVPGGQQSLQPVGAGLPGSGADVGGGCSGPVPGGLESGDERLLCTSECGEDLSWSDDDIHRRCASVSTLECAELARLGFSTGTAAGDEWGSGGDHGSGYPNLRVYSTGGGDGMLVEPEQHRGGDGADPGGDGGGAIGAITGGPGGDREQHARGGDVVVLEQGSQHGHQVASEESGVGGEVDPVMVIPTKQHWCAYLSYLEHCFGDQ